jgi:hypothetical protein
VKKILVLLLVAVMLNMGAAVSLEDNPLALGYIEGYVVKVMPAVAESNVPAHINIETYQGSFYEFPLMADASITIDQRIVKLEEIRKNMEVYGVLQGRQIVSLEAYSTVKMGYIQPGKQVVTGTIMQMSANTIEIINEQGVPVQYNWSFYIPISRKGQAIAGQNLYIGDRVKLYFDEMASNNISRIEVEGDSVLVKDIYRGKLAKIGVNDQQITLKSVEVFKDNSWRAYQPLQKFAIDSGFAGYIGGMKVAPRSLQYYEGKEVYLVTSNVLGKEMANRALIQAQYISTDTNRIQNINWFSQAFELENKKNISFNEATIIIKDERLQDFNVLAPGLDALVISDGNNDNRLAYIVKISGSNINNSPVADNQIWAGKLSQAFEGSLWLENPYKLTDNLWEYSSDDVEVYFDTDTAVYNVTTGKRISLKDLSSGLYSIDESSDWGYDNGLEKWFVYVYANGDRAAAIALSKDYEYPDEHRITNATVLSVEEDSLVGWVVNLQNAMDWSERRQQWMPRNSVLRMGLEEALIIQNNTLIAPDELKPGSVLYISRDDFFGKVILVK